MVMSDRTRAQVEVWDWRLLIAVIVIATFVVLAVLVVSGHV